MIPLRAAIPVKAMKPTIDATESTPPEKNFTPKTAPTKASGMFSMTCAANAPLWNCM